MSFRPEIWTPELITRYLNLHNANDSIFNLKNANDSIFNLKDVNGNTALTAAIFGRAYEHAYALIDRNINLLEKNSAGISPIIAAANIGQYDIIKALVRKNVSIESKDQNGNTPIMIATYYNLDTCISELIKLEADLKAKNKAGDTAFNIAVKKGNWDAACEFIDFIEVSALNFQREDGLNFLMAAVCHGWDNIVKALIQRNVNLDLQTTKAKHTALMIAAEKGNRYIVIDLINAGANFDIQDHVGATPLFRACELKMLCVANVLIEAGANVALKTYERGIDALMVSSYFGLEYLVHRLLEAGADVNVTNKSGHTALTLSLIGQNKFVDRSEMNDEFDAITTALITKGADVNIIVPGLGSALKIATDKGNMKMVELLTQTSISNMQKRALSENDYENNIMPDAKRLKTSEAQSKYLTESELDIMLGTSEEVQANNKRSEEFCLGGGHFESANEQNAPFFIEILTREQTAEDLPHNNIGQNTDGDIARKLDFE
jgi:ankyrin repeat protein